MRWFQLIILLTAPLLSVIDVFIINVAIPSIKSGIHASNAEIQLMIAGYLLGYASFMITSSRLGDHFGRKKIFFIGMLAFTISSCLCGMAVSPLQLNIFRVLQGVSAALMIPQTLSYMQIIFPEHKERTKAVGFYGITLGIASILGQFLGGYLSELHLFMDGWRLIFFINLPVGILALIATARYLKETPGNRTKRFDYGGVVILTAALVALIYPLIQGREQGWPAWSFVLLLVSVLLFIWFIYNQRQKLAIGKNPLIDLRLFKIKDFNIGLLAVSFYFMMHTSYLLIATIYMQNGLHVSAFHTGLYFVVFGSLFTLSSLLAIKLVPEYGKRVLQAGILIISMAFVSQLIYIVVPVNDLHIYLVMSMYGMGAGLVLPSLMTIALKSIPVEFAGAASGVYSTSQQAASAVGISLIGGLFFTVSGTDKSLADYASGFHIAMCAEIACVLVVGILLYILPYEKKK